MADEEMSEGQIDEREKLGPPDDPPESENEETMVVLEDEQNPDEIVLKCKYKGDPAYGITRRAKNSMVDAVNATANSPTNYWRMVYIVSAVTKILKVNMLFHLMPQTKEEIEAFDWSTVIPETKETFPKAKDPHDDDFRLVNNVHTLVKAEKDAAARKIGKSSGGVQSYSTYKQRWKQLRDICAVYRHMHPDMAPETVYNLVAVQLKLCGSMDDVETVIAGDVRNHIRKLRREEAKQRKLARLDQEKEEAAQKLLEATKEREDAEAQRELLAQEKEDIRKKQYEGGTLRLRQAAKKKALLEKLAEEKTAAKVARDAAAKVAANKRKQLDLTEQQKATEQLTIEPAAPAKKKFKRHDFAKLDDKVKPRAKALLDDLWKPPTLRDTDTVDGYKEPGSKWEEASKNKLHLLFDLTRFLKAAKLVEEPMSFSTVMEFCAIDDLLEFHDKVFVYLVALITRQDSDFDQVIQILLAFLNDEDSLCNAEAMSQKTEAELQTSIDTVDNTNTESAAIILSVATELAKPGYNGQIPTTKEGLIGATISECVATKLMQDVFASTELVVSFHARKIVVALDLHDWEESAKNKQEFKMKMLSPERARHSLLKWIPKGERRHFQETMDALGGTLGVGETGFWGKFTHTLNRHFNAKDKKALTEMAESIVQFYRSIKRGGRKDASYKGVVELDD